MLAKRLYGFFAAACRKQIVEFGKELAKNAGTYSLWK
jgi:hypothetical protein